MKKELEFEKINVIEEKDWSDFVSSVYGRPYKFQQQEGCRERGVFRFEVPVNKEDLNEEETINPELGCVSFEEWLARDPLQKADNKQRDSQLILFWEREFYPYILNVVDDLHRKNLIGSGEYMINIDW